MRHRTINTEQPASSSCAVIVCLSLSCLSCLSCLSDASILIPDRIGGIAIDGNGIAIIHIIWISRSVCIDGTVAQFRVLQWSQRGVRMKWRRRRMRMNVMEVMDMMDIVLRWRGLSSGRTAIVDAIALKRSPTEVVVRGVTVWPRATHWHSFRRCERRTSRTCN